MLIKYVGQSIQSFLIPKLCKFYVKYNRNFLLSHGLW